MSAIFLSHSSVDDSVSAEIKSWLHERGHRSVFLDFDPERGIPAGRSWEQELYQQLRSCRAVIVLCSEASMSSRWCFAEITHARSLGKHVFPLKIGPCTVDPVLTDVQVVDYAADPEQALGRLERGLIAAGIDATDPFDWDGRRPPYPGLLAFQEQDAAIFFGRDREIGEGLDLLNQVQRFGGSHLVMVLGASGSGKSSLTLAGILPRLRRAPDRWLILDPFRLGDEPLTPFTTVLARAFDRTGAARDQRELLEELTSASGLADPLVAQARELLESAGTPGASVLMIIDQFEEWLGHPRTHPASFALSVFRSALEQPQSPLVALVTMRADFLGAFQESPQLRGMDFRSLNLGRMTIRNMTEVIEGPARLAGIDLEAGLVQAMLADVETDDALPLLAFSLRELYEGFRKDGMLRVRDYRDELGGLQGSVTRAANAVLAAHRPSPEEQGAMRDAALAMVRISDEGRYVRQPVRWDDLPPAARKLTERFIQARLLVSRVESGERLLEVAHEALLRNWDVLRGWLDENREMLRLRREIKRARRQWQEEDRDADYLLRSGRLQRALELRDEGRLPLAGDDLEFLIASERAAVEYERRRARRRHLVLATAVSVALVVLVFWLMEQQFRKVAEFRQLVMASDDVRETQPLLASMLAREAIASRRPSGLIDRVGRVLLRETGSGWLESDGYRALLDSLARSHRKILFQEHTDLITDGGFSPDGRRVLTVADDGTARIWDLEGRELTVLERAAETAESFAVTAGSWSPDGERVLTVADDGVGMIWSAEGRPLAVLEGHEELINGGAWSPDGRRVLTVSSDATARLWNLQGQPLEVLAGHDDAVLLGAWSPDGERVLTVSFDGTARIWELDRGVSTVLEHDGMNFGAWSPDGGRLLIVAGTDGYLYDATAPDAAPAVILEGHASAVELGAWSPDGERVVTASYDGTARVWSAADGALLAVLEGHDGPVKHAAWAPRGGKILTTSDDGSARVWSVGPSGGSGLLEKLAGHGHAVQLGVWSPDGERVLTIADKVARLWELASNPIKKLEGHGQWVNHGAWSPDGRRVLTVSNDGTARIWDLEGGRHLLLPHDEQINYGAWSPDGERLLTAAEYSARVWSVDGEELAYLDHDGNAVLHGVWSPNGRRVLTVSADDAARVWAIGGDEIDDRPLLVLKGHGGSVVYGDWSPDGRRVLTASDDETARIWGPDGEELAVLTHDKRVNRVAWSPDGRRVLTVSDDGTARVWTVDGDVVEPRPMVLAGHRGRVVYGAWSRPFGHRVLTASDDGTARIWRLEDGTFRELEGHDGPIHRGVWSPDGQKVLTVSEDLTARIWHLDDGAVDVLKGHVGPIIYGAWSPDGRRILTVSADNTARIWPPSSLIDLADRLITRDFTEEERQLYLKPPAETIFAAAAEGLRSAVAAGRDRLRRTTVEPPPEEATPET